MMFKLSWSERPEVAINTLEELDRLLDQLQQERMQSPVIVTVELDSSGDSLSIGIGRSKSVLNFVSNSRNPPYWSSVGESAVDKTLGFEFMGELSEFPLRNAIPTDLARQAVREFASTGKLTPRVTWEES